MMKMYEYVGESCGLLENGRIYRGIEESGMISLYINKEFKCTIDTDKVVEIKNFIDSSFIDSSFMDSCFIKTDIHEKEFTVTIEDDKISNPSHYCFSNIEPIQVIQEWKLNFCLGNAIKYIARAGKKGDKLEDLKKAKQYLEFEIKRMESVE